MQITERSNNGVTVLDLNGKILLGEGDDVVRDKVRGVIAAGGRKLLLNLADVPYVDSAGLGELVRCHTRMVRAGGAIKLLNLTARMQDLLQITKLVTVFETFESEDSAVGSF
jgi:anti-sigma B factor antagonist